MKRSKRATTILRIMTFVIISPIIILWALCALLYLPPIQEYATNKIEEIVAQNSDFRLSIENIDFTFPLKLTINNFSLSKENNIVASGNTIAINIGFIPLLRGEVEVNYIRLEHIALDTHDLINGTHIAGNIEHFRGVARNISLANEYADIRQLHLNGANLNITLGKTDEEKEDSTQAPINWNIHLYKGNIENTDIAINLPQDTVTIASGINKFIAKELQADLAKQRYTLEYLQLANSTFAYNSGTQAREEAPLKHITAENINIEGGGFIYSPTELATKISALSFNQPAGVNINKGALELTATDTEINIKQAILESANGSYINATSTLPIDLFNGNAKGAIEATAIAHINKRDLKGFVTKEQAESLNTLPDSLLDASIILHGSRAKTLIENVNLTIPRIATINANGEFSYMNNKRAEGNIRFNGTITDASPFTGAASTQATPISLTGDAKIIGSLCSANIEIKGNGDGSILAIYDTKRDFYDAKIDFDRFNIESAIATIPLQNITMRASLSGAGTDIFSPQTYYQLFATIDTLQSNNYIASDINISAFQANSLSLISAISSDPRSDFELIATSRINSADISNNTDIKIKNIDLYKIGISDKEVGGSININLKADTDLNETHSLTIHGSDIVINTPERKFTPANIDIYLATAPDSSRITANNGDLNIHGTLSSGYEHLYAQINKLQEMFNRARYSESSIYYAHDYEQLIPATSIDIQCGKQNMLHNFLAINGINFNDINFKCSIDTVKGIRARGFVYDLETAEAKLDTIRFSTIQDGKNIKYFAGVRSSALTPENKKQSFRAALYGNLLRDTLNTFFTFNGNNSNSDTKIGISTLLMPEGLNIHLLPHTKLLGEEFRINNNNYINIRKNNAISADIRTFDKHNSGLHLYTVEDSAAINDITLELFNINLGKLTTKLPFTPNLSGTLNSSIHLRNETEGMVLSGDIISDSLSYEGNYIGNEIAEIVYLPKQKNNHILSLMLYHNNKEYLNIYGDYNDGIINGNATLTKLPLKVMNTFTKESNLNINGYIDGDLSLNGPLSTPLSNGFIQFDSVYVDAPMLGSQIKLVNDKVNIKDSKIKFNNFKIFAKGDTPFKVDGDIDITHIVSPSFNLTMQAKNYELINAPRQKKSVIYGKLILDINAAITGPVESLNVYGNATVLGSTNVTYVMPENNLATNNELDGLVEFVNFNDSIQTDVENTNDFGNTTMSIMLNIEEGAWINADFNSSRDSYINLQGGGQLSMNYSGETGISLTGRYTLNNGKMKYNLPIIPLKTFDISPGSYVSWTGDPMNPTLNITALERIVAPVSIDGGNNQPVTFDVGLVLSNSLDNMGLSFTMKAPENAAIQDELNSFDAETLNKYAVTMLVTGAYVGSNGGLTVSNALTSFLDAKINDIAGDAMKSVSINVGITDIENNETGGSYTNYSFSFAKRFWNDRLTIIIGGEVNSGDQPETDNSFINNVSLEWRLTADGNRYARIFYDKNYESILEGEITETGIGYVYKRKLNNLNELLYIKRRKDKSPLPEEEKR